MTGDEPLLLYVGEQRPYQLLSWHEADDQSFFVAIRGNAVSRELARAMLPGSDQERINVVREQVHKTGGILISASRYGGGSYRLTPRTAPGASSSAAGYRSPSLCQIFGPGDQVTPRFLDGSEIKLESHQYALVPVDREAEKQLQLTVDMLKTMPGDLRTVMVETLTNRASSKAAEHSIERSPVPAVQTLGWVWIALALTLGLGGGAAGTTIYSKYASPAARHRLTIDPARARLDSAIAASQSEPFRTLYENHLSPILSRPAPGTAESSLEPWMLLKLALFKQKPPADLNAFNWSENSNKNAQSEFRKDGFLGPHDRNALLAVTCVDGIPSASFATLEDCHSVIWNQAPDDLSRLTDYVSTRPTPTVATPVAGVTSTDPGAKSPAPPTPPLKPPTSAKEEKNPGTLASHRVVP